MEFLDIQVPSSSIRPTTAIITWKTNYPSSSSVHYWSVDGTQENWNWDSVDDYTQTVHSVELKGLNAFTTYNFTVSSKRETDYAKTTSGEMTFTTTMEGGGSGPVISNVQVPYQLIRTDKATITWDTNVETDSIVYYVETGFSGWSWEGTDDPEAIHSVDITSLKSFTTYRYYINAKDVDGNLTKSDTYEFTTTYDSGSGNDDQIDKIKTNAYLLGNDKFSLILEELNELRNIVEEQNSKIKYLEGLLGEVAGITEKMEKAINNFITYGVDENTKRLGAGERAAVMYSYKEAFKKLPETGEDLADAIKIANGRWPSTTNDEAEKRAKEQFQKIYKRIADMSDPKDNAAITVMAYGLRQKAENRNLESEKRGIVTFKNIYGYNPSSTQDWNTMQAITYSGASRGVDTDGDLLTDDREAQLGTDPNNKDTDGDGHLDGVEVANGYDPLVK